MECLWRLKALEIWYNSALTLIIIKCRFDTFENLYVKKEIIVPAFNACDKTKSLEPKSAPVQPVICLTAGLLPRPRPESLEFF